MDKEVAAIRESAVAMKSAMQPDLVVPLCKANGMETRERKNFLPSSTHFGKQKMTNFQLKGNLTISRFTSQFYGREN